MDDSSLVVEQAVISVKLGDERNEARVVSATKGVSEIDVLTALDYASRVELFDGVYDSKNLFSVPLRSDSVAIGRLTPDFCAPPDSREFYFQCLFVKPEVFLRAGANPATLVHLALNTTRFSLYDGVKRLEPIVLDEDVAFVRQDDLRYAVNQVGTRALVVLVQSLLENERTFFVTDYNVYQIVACVFSLLPVHSRLAITFAAGLKFRGDSAMRLIGAKAPKSKGIKRRYIAGADYFLDLRDVPNNEKHYPIEREWAALVDLVLKSDLDEAFYLKLAKEAVGYQRRQPYDPVSTMTVEEIDELGKEWRQTFEKYLAALENDDSYEVLEDALLDGDSDLEDDDSINEYGILDEWTREESRRDPDVWKRSGESSSNGDFQREDSYFDEPSYFRSTLDELGAPFERDDCVREERALGDSAGDLSADDPSEAVINDFILEARREMEEIGSRLKGTMRPNERGARDVGASEKELDDVIGALSLAPFAILSAEFPESNVELRELDAKVSLVLSRDVGAKESLHVFWTNFIASHSDNQVERIREVYLKRLFCALCAREGEETLERVGRLIGAFDVFDAIMLK